MPSSISSSEAARPGLRLTAADRPGVAQPVPERDVPARPWGPIALGALVLAVLLLGGWESYWRAFGATPGYRNSNGSWAAQRRRIDRGEGSATVLVGSSRVLFDVQLPVWQKITGRRPIQLALEGTSPVPVLQDLANDPDFAGRVLVGVDPENFFTGASNRKAALPYFHKQGPSQRAGHWLSQHFLEPHLAFDDPDFALATVVKRQAWPARPGMPMLKRVPPRKLMVSDADRNSRMWGKVETDPAYRALVRSIWSRRFGNPPPPLETAEKRAAAAATQIDLAVAAVRTLRARGVKVVFLRSPSDGPFYDNEQALYPRAATWDVLLARTGQPGLHFEDYPQLQGYDLPEWSHLSGADARRYTAALVPLVEQAFAAPAPSVPPQ
jgi:hypothetical protein